MDLETVIVHSTFQLFVNDVRVPVTFLSLFVFSVCTMCNLRESHQRAKFTVPKLSKLSISPRTLNRGSQGSQRTSIVSTIGPYSQGLSYSRSFLCVVLQTKKTSANTPPRSPQLQSKALKEALFILSAKPKRYTACQFFSPAYSRPFQRPSCTQIREGYTLFSLQPTNLSEKVREKYPSQFW